MIPDAREASRVVMDGVSCLYGDGRWQIVGSGWSMSLAGRIDAVEAERICRLTAGALSLLAREPGRVEAVARRFCRVRNRLSEDEASPCAGLPICHRCAEEARAAIVTVMAVSGAEGSGSG